MNLQRLIQHLYYEPALITAGAAGSIRRLLESRLSQSHDLEAREPGQGICGGEIEVEQMSIADGIAEIPVGGAIGQKLKPFDRGRGAVDVADIADEIDQAEADKTVQSILLNFDSPGGMVSGTPELADKLKGVQKPIFAFTSGLMASAAYWLASSTDRIFATKSADIGSIGVYLPWVDQTEAFAKEGLKVELIKAGTLKGMGFPGTALTLEQRAHLQSHIDDVYAMFTAHVRTTRGEKVSNDTMQGQTFMAPEALKRGLIDEVVANKAAVRKSIAS